MILPVVKYGNPVLRKRGARIESITPEVTRLIGDMLDTMYDAKGVGLAAQQIGQAVQLTVIDVRGVKDRPSELWLEGEPSNVESLMPLVLINPQIKPAGEPIRGPEGCLSFPELFGDIERPAEVGVNALDRHGQTLRFRAGGLLARVVQHEVDHLNGILFIDRMDSATLAELKPELEELMAMTKRELADAG